MFDTKTLIKLYVLEALRLFIHVGLVLMVISLVGCKEAQDASGTPDAALVPNPVEIEASLAGSWKPYYGNNPGNAYFCSNAPNWDCQQSSANPACWGLGTYNGRATVGWAFDYSNGTLDLNGIQQLVSLSGSTLHLSPSGLNWGVDLLSSDRLVVTFAPGCSILYEK